MLSNYILVFVNKSQSVDAVECLTNVSNIYAVDENML